MRRAALAGLLICSLVVAREAAGDEAERFVETAKALIKAINSDDSAAIQASFDTGMQQLLPPDKATAFFRGIVSAKGKLKEAGAPQVAGPTAIVRVTAERGAWDFKISLDGAGKIGGLLVTPAAAKAPAPGSTPAPAGAPAPAATPTQRFTKVTNKLIQAINGNDSAAIQASFGAPMQQAMPTEKATVFFRGIVSAQGKLKEAGAPQLAGAAAGTGATAIVRVTAEQGAWNFKITLDGADKISGLEVTPAAPAPVVDPTDITSVREWSDATGKFHVNAELVGAKDGNVLLKPWNGQIISVPIAKLSAKDQEAVKKFAPSAAK